MLSRYISTALVLASGTNALFGRRGQDVCVQTPYAAMQSYVSYAPAQSACWASYPGSTSTVTVTGGHTTSWMTETYHETITVPGYVAPTTTPGATTTDAMTTSSVTPTMVTIEPVPTFTPSPTIGPTPTANGMASRNKRRAVMSDSYAQLMDQYQGYGDACMSTACSCIQSPKTTTVGFDSIASVCHWRW